MCVRLCVPVYTDMCGVNECDVCICFWCAVCVCVVICMCCVVCMCLYCLYDVRMCVSGVCMFVWWVLCVSDLYVVYV